MAAKNKTTTYKRKQTSATVTVTPEVTIATADVKNGKDAPVLQTVQMAPIEMTHTMPAIDLVADPATIHSPASGVEVALHIGGSNNVQVTFAAAPASTDDPIAVTDTYSTLEDSFSGEIDTARDFHAAWEAYPDGVDAGKGSWQKEPGVWVGPQELTVTCTEKGDTYDASTSTYKVTGEILTYNGTATAVPVSGAEFMVRVAPLPTNDPHYIVGEDGEPQFTGAWTYEATASFSSLTPAPSYSGYSTAVGTLTVLDPATSETVTVPVTQDMPADAGTVSPLYVSAENTAALAPVTIRPAAGPEKKAYHAADYEGWYAHANCSWIHVHAPKYDEDGELVTDGVGESVGSGLIAKAAAYTDAQKQEAEHQIDNFILKLDANTTGKARVAYPTVKVGRKTYTITVNQEA